MGRELTFRDRLLDGVRQFNKRVYNPIIMAFAAGGRGRPYAVVRHRGRRPGRAYETPVVAQPVSGGFVIPLPYGDRVDWLRNARATGRFVIEFKGGEHAVDNPEAIGAAEALPAFPLPLRLSFRMFRVKEFLKVNRSPTKPEDSSG